MAHYLPMKNVNFQNPFKLPMKLAD